MESAHLAHLASAVVAAMLWLHLGIYFLRRGGWLDLATGVVMLFLMFAVATPAWLFVFHVEPSHIIAVQEPIGLAVAAFAEFCILRHRRRTP